MLKECRRGGRVPEAAAALGESPLAQDTTGSLSQARGMMNVKRETKSSKCVDARVKRVDGLSWWPVA